MVSKEYAAGFAVAVLTALVIFIIIWKFGKTSMKGKFDERQELVRGRGYKYACFTMLGLIALDMLAEGLRLFEETPLTQSLALFLILLAGVMVYAIYCVRHDSYFGIGQDTRRYRAMMWIITVCNAVTAVTGFMEGAVVNGKLNFGPWAALLICIAFAMLGIAYYARKREISMEEETEDASEDE